MARGLLLPKSINYNKFGSASFSGNVTIGGTLEVTGTTTLGTLISGTTTTGALTSSTITSTNAAGTNTIVGTTVVSNFTEAVTAASVRSVQQLATSILTTDKVILLRTTGAGGPFVITPTNLTTMHKVTIIMSAFNTATYTFACEQGTVTFGATGDCASFIYYGTGTTWSLMGAPDGAIVT